MTLKERLDRLPDSRFRLDGVRIRPIRNDEDLWYATVLCQLAPGQEDLVNPAGFSIGRAYLQPETNIPCLILSENAPIGFILLRQWADGSGNGWSYCIDRQHQGRGYGKAAARLAVQLLKAAAPEMPVKLSAEANNAKAHSLYRQIGFILSDELDGDDLIFVL